MTTRQGLNDRYLRCGDRRPARMRPPVYTRPATSGALHSAFRFGPATFRSVQAVTRQMSRRPSLPFMT